MIRGKHTKRSLYEQIEANERQLVNFERTIAELHRSKREHSNELDRLNGIIDSQAKLLKSMHEKLVTSREMLAASVNLNKNFVDSFKVIPLESMK